MDLIGKVLGDRYEIEELIGSGGMARVYKAKCRQLNRYVAIKVLREELKDDTQFVDKFKTEALAAASLAHPNIVSVFDSGEDNGIYYFVMEYVDGCTLKQYIARKGAIEWHEACNIALGICSAIEQAHKNNIVHRDIKPHNIMLNSDGVVKVTDFGIARAVSSSTIVRGGNIIGSVHYFSPEQARGQSSTFMSDIYSIGVVFYEMLAGRVPFDADDPFMVAKMQVEQEPIELKRMNPEIPYAINAVVMCALAKRPEDRFANISEMIDITKKAMEVADKPGDEGYKQPGKADQNTTEIPIVIVDEEDEKKEKAKGPRSKGEKNSTIMGVIIGALIVFIFVLTFAFKQVGTDINKVEVDNLVGENYQAMVEKYKDKYIFIKEEKPSDEFDVGIIIAQTPDRGRIAKNELPKEIRVTVSSGDEVFTMPDYIGDDARDVEKYLKSRDYKVKTERQETTIDENIGKVLETHPEKGEKVKIGDTITLVIGVVKTEDIPDEPDEPVDEPDEPVDEPDEPDNPTDDPGNEPGQTGSDTPGGGTSTPSGDTPSGGTSTPSGGNQGGGTSTPSGDTPDGGSNTEPTEQNPYEGL